MKSEPQRFIPFNAKNGWGTYDQFLPWLEELLRAAKNNPTAKVRVSI